MLGKVDEDELPLKQKKSRVSLRDKERLQITRLKAEGEKAQIPSKMEEGEIEMITSHENWLILLSENPDTEEEDNSWDFVHDSAEESDRATSLSSLREPGIQQVRKNRRKIGLRLDSSESFSSEKSSFEKEEEVMDPCERRKGKEKSFEEMAHKPEEHCSSETLPDFSEDSEILERPDRKKPDNETRSYLTPQDEKQTDRNAQNALLKIKEDLIFYDAKVLDAKIWHYLKKHAEEILKKKNWDTITAKQLERLFSPRSLYLFEKIHASQSLLKGLIHNLIAMEKCLYEFVETSKSVTKWIKAFKGHLNFLINAGLKSFVDYFENNLTSEDKKIILLALGCDAANNLEVLKKWANRSNVEEVKEYLLARERFYLGVENLTEKEIDVSSDIFANPNVFHIPRSHIVRGLLTKNIFEMPHFLKDQKIAVDRQAGRSEVKLKAFLSQILQEFGPSFFLEISPPSYAEKFLKLELTPFDYFFRLLYIGHFKTGAFIHRIFNSTYKKAEIRCLECKIHFENLKKFKLNFAMNYSLQGEAEFVFSLELIPIKKEIPSFKAILKVVKYEFNEEILEEKKNEILECLVRYSNSIPSYKTLPRGISYYTLPGSKSLTVELKKTFEQQIIECRDKHPCLDLFKLEDGYLKECRAAICENHGRYSRELIEELCQKLSLNAPFFDSVIPRISYLAKTLQKCYEEKNRQSSFFEELMKVLRKVLNSSDYKVGEQGITNHPNVATLLKILGEVSDLEIRNCFFQAIGETPEAGERLINFLKESVNVKKIERTLERMSEEYHRYRHEMLSSKCYYLTIPQKLKKNFFSILPKDMFRSYRPKESQVYIFNSIKINGNLLVDLEEESEFLSRFFAEIYAHFEKDRHVTRTDYEVKAFNTFLNTSWKKILPYFFYRKKEDGNLYKNKEFDINALRAFFSSSAINYEEIRKNFGKFKKKKTHTEEELCKIIASWFVSATVSCYPILALGANGIWSVVETILQSTFPQFNQLPFGFKTMSGIDLNLHIESSTCYKVGVIKKAGVCPRLDRWNPTLTAVDNKSPLATLQVESTFSVNKDILEVSVEVSPPVFFRENIYSYEDFYRIINIFEKAVPPASLEFGLLTESQKKKKVWHLKIRDRSNEQPSGPSHSLAIMPEDKETLEKNSEFTWH
ncbi:hypothetical protein [Parachlamydia sp. AcF125]|uniref:hypothetical protein n=1 Tax=Parachlamydia sp. AcF125 TaxID=2795736 RepID=UPI0032D57BB2